ncbi:MAG: hypothetical protein ACXU8R_21645, partial [Xanthobacteraceae bacterium]
LSDALIANIEVEGLRINQLAANFVWDKQRTGTGYICLNQHELLLYGTHGQPPLPMTIVSSMLVPAFHGT